MELPVVTPTNMFFKVVKVNTAADLSIFLLYCISCLICTSGSVLKFLEAYLVGVVPPLILSYA